MALETFLRTNGPPPYLSYTTYGRCRRMLAHRTLASSSSCACGFDSLGHRPFSFTAHYPPSKSSRTTFPSAIVCSPGVRVKRRDRPSRGVRLSSPSPPPATRHVKLRARIDARAPPSLSARLVLTRPRRPPRLVFPRHRSSDPLEHRIVGACSWTTQSCARSSPAAIFPLGRILQAVHQCHWTYIRLPCSPRGLPVTYSSIGPKLRLARRLVYTSLPPGFPVRDTPRKPRTRTVSPTPPSPRPWLCRPTLPRNVLSRSLALTTRSSFAHWASPSPIPALPAPAPTLALQPTVPYPMRRNPTASVVPLRDRRLFLHDDGPSTSLHLRATSPAPHDMATLRTAWRYLSEHGALGCSGRGRTGAAGRGRERVAPRWVGDVVEVEQEEDGARIRRKHIPTTYAWRRRMR
ncbi:hypothetical protein C8R45DRAFT_1147529 [Mycena sanguinolenta]|nr:hypothetical protein C8R45DRAFT_1147529 [Mycena sanguinolenta]